MEMPQVSTAPVNNAKVIREFLAAGARPIETSEYMAFYKACTIEERAQFASEVNRLTH